MGRETAPYSCQSARDHIAAAGRAIRDASPTRTRYSAEFEALYDYAESTGLKFPFGEIPDPPEMAGQEHVVWRSTDRRRVFKATKPNEFGVAVGYSTSVPASDYFSRLSLANRVFGDDIIFEGVATTANGKLQVVTSQPLIVGRATVPQEIVNLMESMGFKALDIIGQPAWYREEDNVMAFDTHTKNFLTTPDGPVPIDVNLCEPDEELKAMLLNAAAQL
jgi:hypothetical protein